MPGREQINSLSTFQKLNLDTTEKALENEMAHKAVAFARVDNLKIILLCPFANAIFRKNKEIRDVLL